jgi:predicted DNA-binding transcriptional regulator YafY
VSKHDRLLQLLSMLRRRRRHSVKDLARECGVSVRTVYRDINTLSEANYPIYYDSGYRMLRTSSFPPVCFTNEERTLLSAMLELWERQGHFDSIDSGRSLRVKLETLCGLPGQMAGAKV